MGSRTRTVALLDARVHRWPVQAHVGQKCSRHCQQVTGSRPANDVQHNYATTNRLVHQEPLMTAIGTYEQSPLFNAGLPCSWHTAAESSFLVSACHALPQPRSWMCQAAAEVVAAHHRLQQYPSRTCSSTARRATSLLRGGRWASLTPKLPTSSKHMQARLELVLPLQQGKHCCCSPSRLHLRRSKCSEAVTADPRHGHVLQHCILQSGHFICQGVYGQGHVLLLGRFLLLTLPYSTNRNTG